MMGRRLLRRVLLHGRELVDLRPQLVELLPQGGGLVRVVLLGFVVTVVDEVGHGVLGVFLDVLGPVDQVVDEVLGVVDDVLEEAGERIAPTPAAHHSPLWPPVPEASQSLPQAAYPVQATSQMSTTSPRATNRSSPLLKSHRVPARARGADTS